LNQAENNPYKYTATNKRYYTYDHFLKTTFGKKCAKITLDLGFTCPNIDGTKGKGGCIYCSGGSFARNVDSLKSSREQYQEGIEIMKRKWDIDSFIPYLQAYTNSYTSPDNFRKILEEVSDFEGAVMVSIATRADCLENEKLEILSHISQKIPITVELGLQTASDKTARLINRCHTYEEFKDCFYRIRRLAPKVKICIHIINGLPGETRADMLATARAVAALRPDQVKIHLMHVLSGTALGRMYEEGKYTPMTRDEYVSVTVDQLELLPPDTVIGRLTGDGLSDELLAPDWSRKKTIVLNEIDKELYKRGSYQGIYFKEE
jgi:radical SAM protein (TIGR01212 family)